MDSSTLRILNTISSNLGNSLSINQLTEQIKNVYGSAYYANIYQKLQQLKNEDLLNLEPTGKSCIIKLNFENYFLIDKLAEMEIEKKIEFFSNKNNLFPFLAEMDKALTDKNSIKSISIINPLKNIKLNRIDLLFQLRETSNYLNETIELYKEMLNLQKKHNIKTNNLILNKHDFFDLITSDEINPVREAMSEKITLFCPQTFWNEIKEIIEKHQIRTICSETKLPNISEPDLTYNLNRFGYKEFGTYLQQGKKFCIEYIITTILLEDEARKTEAAAIILAKNTFKSNLLTFLSQKYETSAKLLGILKTLQKIKTKPEITDTIHILQAFNQKELPTDENSIKQKLELYNAL